MANFEKPLNSATSDSPETESGELIFGCTLNFNFTNPTGLTNAPVQAEVCLSSDTLIIRPVFGDTLDIPLREISVVKMLDYRFELELSSGEQLICSALGYQYENFGRYLNRLRNEILLHDLLMTEQIKQTGFAGMCEVTARSNQVSYHGSAEIRLYETGLVLLPEFTEPLRFPYSEFQNVTPDDYSVTIVTEGQCQLKIMQMGTLFHPFLRDLSAVLQELSQKNQNVIRQLLPQFDQSTIRKAVLYLRDGKAARRKDLDSVTPQLWTALEERIIASELGAGYQYLTSLAPSDLISIGYKRGLLGDLGSDYLWFLVPVCHEDFRQPGNALALEALTVTDSQLQQEEATPQDDATDTSASTLGSGGRATYFFRILDRGQDKHYEPDFINRQISELITTVNHCMITINFRREPIYLEDSRLRDSRCQHYFYAVRSIPELRELRERFIGRVIHRNSAQWQRDVTDLLNFNVSVSDNTARWKRT